MSEKNKDKNEQQNGLITKWGNEVFDDGVMNAPMCITKYGYRFVSGGEFSFIMCLLSFKFDNRNPYPSQETIANDMGVHVSQIERWVNSLFNKKGLININDRYLPDGTRTSNEYDFSPLLEKCLEESRKEKDLKNEPKVKSKPRQRSKKKEEKKAEEIPPTKCMDGENGEKGDEIYPIQNVGVDRAECMAGSSQNVGVDPRQNVGTKKVIEEGNLEEGNLNNVIDDDDKELEEEFHINKYSFREFVEHFNENYPDQFDRDMYLNIYQQMEKQKLDLFTVDEAVRQVKRMKNYGHEKINDYAAYFIGGIIKNRTSKRGALVERRYKKEVERLKAEEEQRKIEEKNNPFPFYNWLEA